MSEGENGKCVWQRRYEELVAVQRGMSSVMPQVVTAEDHRLFLEEARELRLAAEAERDRPDDEWDDDSDIDFDDDDEEYDDEDEEDEDDE